MWMLGVPGLVAVMGSEDLLDALEQLLRNQRLVCAWVLHAIVGDDAGVDLVVEHCSELGSAERGTSLVAEPE